jgi:hypothetical protein
VVFHQVKDALQADKETIQSPLTDLLTLDGFDPKALFVQEEMYLILRAWGRKIAQSWGSAIFKHFESKAADLTKGTALQAYTKHCMDVHRHSQLTMVGMTYKAFLRDRLIPEDVLRSAAEAAKTLRKVSDQEALLKAWGGIFTPAAIILQNLDRVIKLPNAERTEEEKLMRDELVGIREFLERASALADALTKILK